MVSQMLRFAGFTDIEFNPAKSVNCQVNRPGLIGDSVS